MHPKDMIFYSWRLALLRLSDTWFSISEVQGVKARVPEGHGSAAVSGRGCSPEHEQQCPCVELILNKQEL